MFFTALDKQAVVVKDGGLYLLNLSTGEEKFENTIRSYKYPNTENSEWLGYQKSDTTGELILLNLTAGNVKRFYNIIDYFFDDKGTSLILVSEKSIGISQLDRAIFRVDLLNGSQKLIWNSEMGAKPNVKINALTLNGDGSQLAFFVQEQSEAKATISIWYYDSTMDRAELKVNDQTIGIPNGYEISSDLLAYSKSNNWLFFHVQRRHDDLALVQDGVRVDVWNYKDPRLQSEQLADIHSSYDSLFTGVIDVKGENATIIAEPGEKIETDIRSVPGDHIVISEASAVPENSDPPASYYLVSLKNGVRKALGRGKYSSFYFHLWELILFISILRVIDIIPII